MCAESGVSLPSASFTCLCDLYRWLGVLWWVQTPSHTSFLHQPFSFLCSQNSPLARLKNGPFATKAECFSSPRPGICKSFAHLGLCSFSDLWLLPDTSVPLFWGERQGLYCSSDPTKKQAETGFTRAAAGVLEWDAPSSGPGGVWHNPDIVYWLHITWGIHT